MSGVVSACCVLFLCLEESSAGAETARLSVVASRMGVLWVVPSPLLHISRKIQGLTTNDLRHQ